MTVNFNDEFAIYNGSQRYEIDVEGYRYVEDGLMYIVLEEVSIYDDQMGGLQVLRRDNPKLYDWLYDIIERRDYSEL